uniref:Craniofacial development protein 1 n=1 Tax=Heligmosomoides polygyrus TaxID=6339 RepID=A0A183FUM3_HELPZ
LFGVPIANLTSVSGFPVRVGVSKCDFVRSLSHLFRRSGLGGALTLIAKKPKMSVLDKSNLDWSSYKAENNLQEELERFNRGKNGYLEKMEFLSRTDYKEFEKEKAVRNASRKPI